MHKYNAHAATDITGFGLLGHAQALARNQKAEVRTSRSSILLSQGKDQGGINSLTTFKRVQILDMFSQGWICDPQLACDCQDGRRWQGMWQHVPARPGDDLSEY